jgi:hypothetical protein
MSLSTSTETQSFDTAFTITLQLLVEAGTDPETGLPITSPISDVPTVTVDITDPGVRITPGAGTVTISGSYLSIIPIQWFWKDSKDILKTAFIAPAVGTYTKIIEVIPPPLGTSRTATYTITSSAGVDTFSHTVVFDNFTKAADKLQIQLTGQPEP